MPTNTPKASDQLTDDLLSLKLKRLELKYDFLKLLTSGLVNILILIFVIIIGLTARDVIQQHIATQAKETSYAKFIIAFISFIATVVVGLISSVVDRKIVAIKKRVDKHPVRLTLQTRNGTAVDIDTKDWTSVVEGLKKVEVNVDKASL